VLIRTVFPAVASLYPWEYHEKKMLIRAVADVDYARATVHSPVFAAAAAGHGAVGTAAQWRSRTLPVQGLHLRAYVEKGEEPVIESGELGIRLTQVATICSMVIPGIGPSRPQYVGVT
jgi:hypothetical protein